MADLIIPPGYVQMTLELTHATIAHKALVTLGASVTSPPFTQANNTAVLAAWASALQPLYDNEVTFSRLVTLAGNDGPALRYESSGTTQGTRTTVIVSSPQVTYLIRKVTGFAGRRYRGRMYLPFVNSAGMTQTGSLTAAELTLLTNRAAEIELQLFGFVGLNLTAPYLLHATSPLSATPVPTLISDLAAQGVVATQRKRLERT